MKIVFPDPVIKSEPFISRFKELGVELYGDMPKTEADLIERVKDAEIITANYVDITSAVIDASPKLKYIIVPAVGYEWIDIAHASSKGIRVVNCPTFNSQAVAEHAVGLMFTVAKRITVANISLRGGEWKPAGFEGIQLSGKKLGLIGYGNIGKRIEAMAKGIGMNVSYTNSKSTSEDLSNLLSTSDVVVLCLPLTDKSKGMIGADQLKLLKPTAILINIARAAIVDQAALKIALEQKAIAGAGIDVFTDEPFNSEVAADETVEMAKLLNVVATPHAAYNTAESAENLQQEVYDNLLACLKDEPINVVAARALRL